MKTAVSIPDHTFSHAEMLAKQLGTSRSKLYADALESYMLRYDADEITRRLNEVYDQIDSRLAPDIAANNARMLAKEDW